MQLSRRGREITLSTCSKPRRVIGVGVSIVTPKHCRCREVMDARVYMLPAVNHMSHTLLPNHYASPYTKRPSGPGPHHHESVLLHYSIGLPNFLYYLIQAKDGVSMDKTFRAELKTNFSMQLIQNRFSNCLKITMKLIEEIKEVRVLAVASRQQDNVDITQQIGRALQISSRRKDKGRSKAVVVREAVHAWDMQFPELFASGIKA
jgi:hypothetical protein